MDSSLTVHCCVRLIAIDHGTWGQAGIFQTIEQTGLIVLLVASSAAEIKKTE